MPYEVSKMRNFASSPETALAPLTESDTSAAAQATAAAAERKELGFTITSAI